MSLYWDNIDPAIVREQAEVFRHLGYEIEQVESTGLHHGDFLDERMRSLRADDSALFVDIDCIPLNSAIIDRAFAVAEAGGILGCAQASAHVDSDRIYTGPMFLAVARSTWDRIGQPSFGSSPTSDPAQDVHDAAVREGVHVEYLEPWATALPQWRLGAEGLFGFGTFYRGGVFHLFQSRDSQYAFLLHELAADVIADRQPDVLAYCRRTLDAYARNWNRPSERLARLKSRVRLRSRLRSWWGGAVKSTAENAPAKSTTRASSTIVSRQPQEVGPVGGEFDQSAG